MDKVRFDEMAPEEVKAYINAVELDALDGVLSSCSFACLKRTYEKYFGIRPVSTMSRERVQRAFWNHRVEMRQAVSYGKLVV